MEREIVEIVRSVTGGGEHLLHEPLLCGREKEYAAEVISSGHLSAGKWVDRLEHQLADFLGAKHCVATTNGTAALHVLALLRTEHAEAQGKTSPHSSAPHVKKKFYLPSLTFVATANAVSYTGHPIHFVDIGTYSDVAVDFLGHPSPDQTAWMRDSAQALGSRVNGRYVGSSRTGMFSFNQNKIITGGSGGMIYTDSQHVATQARHLTTTARIPHAWNTTHDRIAFNYRMGDLTAAVLCAQLEQLPLIVKAKRALAMKYKAAFASDKRVAFWDEPVGCESNFWMNAVTLDDDARLVPCLKALHKAGIRAKGVYEPIHRLPMYADCARDDMTVTEDIARRTILLPSSPKLGVEHA